MINHQTQMQPSSTIEDAVDIDNQRKKLDEDIEKLLQVVRDRKSQRNLLAPIFRLPPEILCKVFSMVRKEDRSAFGWIKVSYICQHWRDVALGLVDLWNDPPIWNPEWTEEMLNRSGAVDLTIKVELKRYNGQFLASRMLQILEQNSSRITHILIAVTEREIHVTNFRLPTSAPRLHTLVIDVDPTSWLLMGTSGLDILQDATNLRRLQIVGWGEFDWSAPYIAGITQLILRNTAYDSEDTDFSPFISALTRMTELQHLELDYGIPRLNTIIRSPVSIHTHLSRLTSMTVNCTSAEAFFFFRHVTFNPTAKVTVVLYDNHNLGKPDGGFLWPLFIIAGCYLNLSQYNMRFRTVVLDRNQDLDNENHTQVKIFTNAFEGDADKPDQEPLLTLNLSWATIRFPGHRAFATPNRVSAALSEICRSGLPIYDISHVHLNQPDGSVAPAEALASGLGSLPMVTFIRTWGQVMTHHFLESLVHDGQNGPLHTEDRFSNLESIHFEDVMFTEKGQETSDRNAFSFTIDFELLRQCLVTRRECGVPVKHITLKNCTNLTEGDVVEMRHIGVDVDWDYGPQ